MTTVLGVSSQALFGQLLIGLINGSFYALLSLGLALIFGLLNIINFAHGALYMMGAFCAWLLLEHLGVGYWGALLLAPLIVGAFGAVVERLLLRRIQRLDHLYGLLLTFGLALVVEGAFRLRFGTAGQAYAIPPALAGGQHVGFMFLPHYRVWVVGASATLCLLVWALIEKTRLGAHLRAATENAPLARALGIRVPPLVTLAYAGGAALAALAGVMAAPMYQVSPHMGSDMVVVVFAIVVIGGMGSLAGAIASGFALGVVEGLTRVFYPQASSTVIFVAMALVLLLRPGTAVATHVARAAPPLRRAGLLPPWASSLLWALALAAAVAAPFTGIYHGFLLKALCFALFASAFNLLIGFAGLLSFGHAAYFGVGAYVAGHAMKVWQLPPEWGLLAGAAAAAALSLLFGALAIRRQGIHFAMVTLALAQMVYFFCVQAPFTGGEDGLRDVPRGMAFGVLDLSQPLPLYFFVLAVCAGGCLAVRRVVRSPFGQVLLALRENEARAVSLGYPAARCKLIAFVLSSALAGLAGATKVLVFQIATLADVHWSLSGEVMLMTLVGGLGTLLGPVIGATSLVAMDTYLAHLGPWIGILQGGLFIACVLALRGGLGGALSGLFSGLSTRAAPAPTLFPAPPHSSSTPSTTHQESPA